MIKLLDRLLRWSTGLMAASALFSIMWLTLVDVLGRKFFNHSLPGALEITEILMVVVIFGALPLVSWRGEHVVFDSLDKYLPAAVRWVQQRAVHLVCAGVFGWLARLMVMRGDRFAEYGDTTSRLLLPIAPVAYLMAALLLVTALIHLFLVFVTMPPADHLHGDGEKEQAAP